MWTPHWASAPARPSPSTSAWGNFQAILTATPSPRTSRGAAPDSDTLYRLRDLTTDLVPTGSSRDLDLSQVADGGTNVNGLLYLDGSFYTVLSTTIAPQCGHGDGSDVADSDLIMIRFDENWTYRPATDVSKGRIGLGQETFAHQRHVPGKLTGLLLWR